MGEEEQSGSGPGNLKSWEQNGKLHESDLARRKVGRGLLKTKHKANFCAQDKSVSGLTAEDG